MSVKYQQIAQILCTITNQLIADESIQFNDLSLQKVKLKSRVGSGLSTYCRHELKKNTFTITYGKKMIKSKFNQNEVKHWLTYREIIKRHYYNGEISVANLLAHTICHEFSHLIQQLSGWHKRGSIHNHQYYKILDYMHDAKIAENIKARLVAQCLKSGIDIEYDILTRPQLAPANKTFIINDTISFEHKQKTYTGKVVKVNRKTLIVSVKKLFKYSSWKVPKQLAKNAC
ncbi:MAG: hypothetical protein OEY11_07905 [Gammaproteobacteria bacterium]|nr:hypothetical protein [Gammaproteobacteria bacterium]